MAHDSLRQYFNVYQIFHCVRPSILSRIRRSLNNVMRPFCMQDFQATFNPESILDLLKKIRLYYFISIFDTKVVSLAAALRPELWRGLGMSWLPDIGLELQ